ncbi:hypothetical protein JAAARDRAFT_74362 [Jaapia argillacea MUCL 33604]|uniref:Flavin reductase like domain-containing protein n=1 Tax=Jaapia argillacea MUCL 33604 TaxID=933084 RepID=A0A067P5U1_9AGAM|nr:hypothetical protein JAAARDRAFT_74362 [Jaapia argillacea MUCL 33604]
MLRGVARTSRRWSSSLAQDTLHHRLRTLLRESAQPVAIVTSYMPPTASKDSTTRYHGATLSSFTSIAMDPYPLVAFSLRIPSRMATSLKAVHPKSPCHMVINVLSAAQASTAVKFSRVDLYPKPFETVQYSLTREGFPVLDGCLGSLSCKMVTSWPLHDLGLFDRKAGSDVDEIGEWEGEGVASELFLARVVRVESLAVDDDDRSLRRLPLLYHRRDYGTTSDILPLISTSGSKNGP